MTRPRFLVVALVVAVVATAGCRAAPVATASPTTALSSGAGASGAPGSPGGPEPSSVATIDACAMLRPGVATAFSRAAMGPAQQSDRGDAETCVYGSAGGGPETVGITVTTASAETAAIDKLAKAMPDAVPAVGLDRVLVATGAAWFVKDRHLVSVVLVEAGGVPGTPARMRDLVLAILSGS